MANEQTPLFAVVRVEPREPRYHHSILRRICTAALSTCLVAVVVCFLVSTVLFPHQDRDARGYAPTWADGLELPHIDWPNSNGIDYGDLQKLLLETPDNISVRHWSHYYTAGPHLAGKNLSQAIWTRERWAEFGISSDIVAYDVFLNYPREHRLALLEVSDNTLGSDVSKNQYHVKYECDLEEEVLDQDETSGLADRIPTFHGYSASGNVTASYVYVNFGTWQDFEDLIAANVSMAGKIAIAKYGHVFRGLKVKRAQELGMVGMVMYSDPQEDGQMTETNGYKAYPQGPARNPTSVQRGSTQFLSPFSHSPLFSVPGSKKFYAGLIELLGILPGDPTTPGIPSKPGVPRSDPSEAIPSIPSVPISYKDAVPLLKALNGHGPPVSDFNQSWQGGGLTHEGIHYDIGPSPDSIVLTLLNDQEYVTTPIWNVVGIINGSIPDEVIVLGNHRDAWIAGGAGDPHSGSAAFNEVIRAFGMALRSGWKPLRTIVFASWDGEEYGLLGSTEWVEEFVPWLSASAVAYLNVDIGARGSRFEAAASPLLNKALYDAVGLVPSPNQAEAGRTVLDTWDKQVKTMGSGSDFTAFQDYAGIPSMDIGFSTDDASPVYHYHSNYDSFHWMDTYGDPDWSHHVAMARTWALIAASLSETPVLNLNATDYAHGLVSYLENAKEKARKTFGDSEFKFSFQELDQATARFLEAAVKFDAFTADLSSQLLDHVPWWKWWKKVRLYYQIRTANSKYKALEKQFLHPEGLDGRTWFKHVVFAPGRWTGYSGATFPGLLESFEDHDWARAGKWSRIIAEKLYNATTLLG